MNLNPYLDVAPEVAAAVAAGKPVVALESTIISHGMPYPQNVETALKVEQIIRDNGELPAFYTRKSGFEVDYRVDTPAELAAAFRASLDLGLRGGMLVTNPIPEEFAMDHEVINRAIDEAVAQANAQGIHGKATTPFLLAKVKELTGGDSLDSNIQLVFNNARLAAQTAAELCRLG